jgi:guanine deaminase
MPTLCGTLLQPLSPTDCRVTPGALVSISDAGRVTQIATGTVAAGAVGDDGCWILPGFIDAHLHVPQWDRRGIDGLPLGQWQQSVGYPAEARMADSNTARDIAQQFVTGMIANGTTTVAAFGSPFAQEVDSTFAVFEQRGLRAIYGMMLNDRGCPAELTQTPDSALEQSRTLAAKWHGAQGGRLRYAFSPRTPIRCSEEMMRGAATLAGMLKCHLQTHVAESLEELAEVRELYPDFVDEVDVFCQMGMLSSRTLLAHGVFMNQQQRRQLADSGAALVHCPTANLFRESGLMDYVAHCRAGIRIALGSSIAGGPEPFMPRVAAEGLHTAKAIKVHTLPRRSTPVPTPVEAWWVLTRGAAHALNIADQTGGIEPGLAADCLVVRPEKWIADLPPQQQISALLYTIAPSQIEHVYIAGRRVGP